MAIMVCSCTSLWRDTRAIDVSSGSHFRLSQLLALTPQQDILDSKVAHSIGFDWYLVHMHVLATSALYGRAGGRCAGPLICRQADEPAALTLSTQQQQQPRGLSGHLCTIVTVLPSGFKILMKADHCYLSSTFCDFPCSCCCNCCCGMCTCCCGGCIAS